AGAGADDGHPFSGEVIVMVPARTVDLVAPVAVETTDVRPFVVEQRPGRQHDGAGPESSACHGGHAPHALVFVEVEVVDLAAELNAPPQVECVDHALDVFADLTGRRVRSRPVRV